jgi:hypothetical protein
MRVTAPDEAAGKKAKCPKCAATMLLPGGSGPSAVPPPRKQPPEEEDERPVKKPSGREEEDEEEDERPPRKSARRRDEDDEDEERPAKKSSRRIAASEDDEDERPRRKSRRDEDDEEDDDDRPRKKGKGKATKKGGPPLPLLIGGGVLLLLLAAGGAYFAFSGDSSSGTGGGGGGGPKGVNWVAFNAPDGSFSTAFPDAAPTDLDLDSLIRQTQKANATEEEVKMAKDMMTAFKIQLTGWSGARGGKNFFVVVTTIPPGMPVNPNMDAAIEQVAKVSGSKIVAKNPFSHGGLHGMHFTLHDPKSNKWVVTRQAQVGKGKTVALSVMAETELKDDDAEAKAFFEKFQWKQ